MNIRKQLDGLLKGNGQKKILKERINDRKVYDELGKVLFAIDSVLDAIERPQKLEDNVLEEKLNKIYEEVIEILKDFDDGRFGGEQGGDISSIGRDKLEEFADRNTITDKPGDEKVWGAVASVLGDKDD
jgi:hypothetical protein